MTRESEDQTIDEKNLCRVSFLKEELRVAEIHENFLKFLSCDESMQAVWFLNSDE